MSEYAMECVKAVGALIWFWAVRIAAVAALFAVVIVLQYAAEEWMKGRIK